ncbi:excinuclease ABC subunit UvrB [Candidatus Wolfebacteria bacterium]|nr:excinuclease ABC subunit UvrB [Candidatus Wolfebacteria bacterium]
MSVFKLQSPFQPAGDQPRAIEKLVAGVRGGAPHQTLLGVTGSGKTFTVANVIAAIGKPTLVIAHNKTLAAQLAQEYREFFPDAAVQYFVSYYDYYQPEAYMPISDTYIEKEAQINEEIDRLRHAATQALLTRPDVVVVASVSAIYGLGNPEEYKKVNIHIQKGDRLVRAELIRRLVDIYYERTNADLSPGAFRAVGNTIEIMPANERTIVRVEIEGGAVVRLAKIDAVSRGIVGEAETVFLFPAKHFVTPEDEKERAVKGITEELAEQLKKFDEAGKLLEAERLKRRTNYDLALIREVGYCNGIENYSRHFDGRRSGEPPNTLLSYFPHDTDGKPDFLTVIDESHVTVSQIAGMYNGDRARKETLVEHGFRLPSAKDNRPLTFDEFTERVGQVVYTSATPADYELQKSRESWGRLRRSAPAEVGAPTSGSAGASGVVEQIIRPTGLVDPELIVKPIQQDGEYLGQVKDFIAEAEAVIAKDSRVIATTLTKKMAEDLAEYLKDRNIRAEYLHSDIKTIERIEILTKFRRGEFDIVVGVNLLREGLDLPEVELIGILDADKEGFLRSETSLIQTIGRAARNVNGRVILYADNVTGSMERAIGETNRRRNIQLAYNAEHGITPQTIKKKISDITDQLRSEHQKAAARDLSIELGENPSKGRIRTLIKEKNREMSEAVKELDFESAAILRDEVIELEEMLSA